MQVFETLKDLGVICVSHETLSPEIAVRGGNGCVGGQISEKNGVGAISEKM